MSKMALTSNTSTLTQTRLKGQWVWLGRSIWVILATTTIIAFIIAIPIRFQLLNTVCNADCTTMQISEEGLKNIEDSLGLSLSAYAVIINSKEILLGLVYIIAGVVIFWRRSDDWLVILISLTVIIIGPSFGVFFLVDNLVTQILQGIAFFLIIQLFFLFPDGRFSPTWTRWIGLIFGIPSLIISTTPFILSPPFLIFLITGLTIGLISQVYRYRHLATAVQRQQTKWVVLGFGTSFIGLFFLSMPSILFPSLSSLTEPTLTVADFIYRAIIGFFLGFLFLYFLPIAIAFSTLRYRLWDADPIINRGLVYGFMTLFAVALLFVITYLIQFLFGEQQPFIAILIAGAFSVMTFHPARKRIQHWVDRNLYGLRFDLNELQAAQESHEIRNPGALTGQIIDGYEVLGVIGKGGMGEVYRGYGDGQYVAIKTMLPEVARDDTMRTRFQREADAGKQLQHQHIASVYASGIVDDTPYLIMEYVEGTELGMMLKRDGAIDTETTCHILHDICTALELVHQQGYVHRDLKPANIMIRENGEAVLMDFGITKMQDTTSALTGTGVIGTIDYMAPEQITSAKEVDHRADIYALGVMLYEMLTGEKPFSGSPAQVMFAHIQQPPPDIRQKDASIPLELADVVDKALEKDPEDRFETVHEFNRMLNGVAV